MKIAVYGLGKLGLPLVSVLARDSDNEVIGVDPDEQRVDFCQQSRALYLSSGVVMGEEPDLRLDGDLRFQTKAEAADVSFVVVPTPSAVDDSFNAMNVMDAVNWIVDVNRRESEKPYYIVITSTVSPGTCDQIHVTLPQTAKLVYNPTFIALGSVVRNLLQPELLLIGADEEIAAETVHQLWMDVMRPCFTPRGPDPYVHEGSFVEVELLKLSINCALSTKIALANSLGELFTAYDVDPSRVAVMGVDSRIGASYMTPGSPISGPCLPRDNRALQRAAAKKNVAMRISEAVDDVDYDLRMKLFAQVIHSHRHTFNTIGILGMTYKYGIPVTEGSIGVWLKDKLTEHDYEVLYYDNDLSDSDDLENVLVCDVVVVAHREFEHLIEHISGKVVKVWS